MEPETMKAVLEYTTHPLTVPMWGAFTANFVNNTYQCMKEKGLYDSSTVLWGMIAGTGAFNLSMALGNTLEYLVK
jgi:hypothetical protein